MIDLVNYWNLDIVCGEFICYGELFVLVWGVNMMCIEFVMLSGLMFVCFGYVCFYFYVFV